MTSLNVACQPQLGYQHIDLFFFFFLTSFLFAFLPELKREECFIFVSTREQKELEYFPQVLFCLFRFLKTTARKEFIQLPVGTF